MNTRTISLVVASALLALGCSKEGAPTAADGTDASPHAAAVTPAPASAPAPVVAPMPATAVPATAAAPATTAIPSQADESIAAAKEIDKSNYKSELAAIAKELP